MRTRELGSYTVVAVGWILLLAAGVTVYFGTYTFLTADGWIFDAGDGAVIVGAGPVMAAAGVALIRRGRHLIRSGRRLKDKRRQRDEE